MKNFFAGYYPPTSEEYERLWKEALIVLDTNVLLNLYRLPTSARDELFTALELLKNRLWIPHQVALEFQRRRLTVIATERKSTEDALGVAQEIIANLRKKVESLQIEKRELGINTKPILDDLEQTNEKLVHSIEITHKSQFEISSNDPVRDRLDILLASRVGNGPSSQKELDDLMKNGDERFRDRIPPGFADTDKEKNVNEATFIHDHLKYQRKFGDLILWRQLINHVKDSSIKAVLLITADRKEDWWWREQGKTIGAHPELVSEIKREADVDIFWMYSAVQFIEHANKYTAASVSTQAVQELEQVVVSPWSFDVNKYVESFNKFNRGMLREEMQPTRYDIQNAESSVLMWLSSRHEEVCINERGFPDFIVYDNGQKYGYEVKYARNFDRMLLSSNIINSVLRGYLEVKEGRLSDFSLVVVISENDFFEIMGNDRIQELNKRLSKLLSRYPISSIIVGSVIGSTFDLLTIQRGDDSSYMGQPSIEH